MTCFTSIPLKKRNPLQENRSLRGKRCIHVRFLLKRNLCKGGLESSLLELSKFQEDHHFVYIDF